MDPLSATANIVAVLVVTIQSCNVLIKFFRGLADAPLEIRHNSVWLGALHSTFGGLRSLVADPRFADIQAQLPVGFASRLAECQADLGEMEARIRRVDRDLRGGRILQTWTKVKYTFTSEQLLVKFSGRIQLYQSAFTVDLMTIQLKLTILYNSNPTGQPPSSESASRQAIDSSTVCLSSKGADRLSRFLASSAEPVSVRVGTWHSLETRIGRFEFWCGPVLKQKWRPDCQPEFTVSSPRCVYGFGFRAYLFWGEKRKGFCAICMPAESSGSPSLSSMRLNFSFPHIVTTHADIFQFISTRNLPAIQHMFSTHKATRWDTTPNGHGLLHAASTTGSPDIVDFLIRQGVDVNSQDDEGRTPLHCAVTEHGNYETCRALLENGADIGNRDVDGRTPLHAFFSGTVGTILTRHHETVSEVLLTRDASGMTILQYVAWSCQAQPQHLEPYLRNGDISAFLARDYAGRSSLHFAAQRGNISLLRYLLDVPTDLGLEIQDAMGQSVLHYAVHSRRTEVIDLLLTRGVGIGLVDSNGRTLLHAAARRNNLAAVKRVLELCDASILNLRDKDGMTPTELAYRYKSLEAASYLLSLEGKKADWEERNSQPLAARRADVFPGLKILVFLISAGAVLWRLVWAAEVV